MRVKWSDRARRQRDEVANYIRREFGDWNSPEAVLQAAQFCEEQREECLRNQQSLIFETVLSSDGKPFKRYTDDIPLWAQTIID
jgi:plasmid stabilization system protein ParE